LKKTYVEFFGIVFVLLVMTFIFSFIDADRAIGRLVILPNNKWPGINTFPWEFFYTYAAVPGFSIAGIGLLIFFAGYWKKQLEHFRRQALFLVLLLALGPGLVVNVIFKDNLGRARPREIKEFGGKYEYTEIWQPGATGKNSSFPSGHASVAFYLMGPWFLLRNRKKKTALFFLSSGLVYGIVIGVTRIIQGGHFLSDVMWAGGFVYLVGLLLSKILETDQCGVKTESV
jgi:membrane-associated PAP2 superfamily phosphatase